MTESHTPLTYEPAPERTITDYVLDWLDREPGRVLFERRGDGDAWLPVTAAEFIAEARAVAKGLVAAGVGAGDRVGLLARTSYEWSLIDFSIWFLGGVSVPIYETSSAEQVNWIVSDSGLRYLIVEDAKHAALTAEAFGGEPDLAELWVINDGALDQLKRSGEAIGDDQLAALGGSRTGADPATLIYTSGTTGRPKGVVLSHRNFTELTLGAMTVLPVIFAKGGRTLMFLPLAHVFARFIEVMSVIGGTTMGHTPDLKQLLPDVGSYRPTFILAVPRVFEKIYNSAEQKAEGGGRGKIFRAAADTAIVYSQAQGAGKVPLTLRLRHAVFDRLVYSKLRTLLGGRVEYAVSGGGPLGTRLGHFYHGLGITVLEGYGLTETTAPIAVNPSAKSKIGTVGLPMPGHSAKLAEDGELLGKGPGVFSHYWNNEAATAEAFVDGWFRTGDLGAIDDEGYVTIVGRKKEILVTAGGKNVSPAQLEDRLRRNPLIDQAIVVGDQRPFIAALVTLDEEMLGTWLANKGREPLTLAEAANDVEVHDEIDAAIAAANASVSRAESVRKFTIMPVTLSEASGHLSAKQSLKRHVVNRDFAAEIDALYGGPLQEK